MIQLACGRVVFGGSTMDALEAFLDSYGVAAACAVMLVKAIGVPIPVPGDVILLATAARAAEGKVLLWLAFVALLAALTVGGTVLGLAAWFVIARRRHATNAMAVNAWAQATCPVCLVLGSVSPLHEEAAVPWVSAA